jgi:hypothetical protein
MATCLRSCADIRDEADRWVVRGISDAIEAGCTRAEVGTALGVSRQAPQLATLSLGPPWSHWPSA